MAAARPGRRSSARLRAAALLALLAGGACRFDPQLEGKPCAATAPHCPTGLVCVAQICARPAAPVDGAAAQAPAGDAGGPVAVDPDASGVRDLGAHERPDASAPVVPDAAVHAAVDAAFDGGVAGGREAGPPAGADGAADRPADAAADPCVGACVVGARRCGADGRVETCAAQAGCATWSAAPCPGQERCVTTATQVACCLDRPECAGAPGARCVDGAAVTCTRAASGCLEVTRVDCAQMKKTCQLRDATATCACPASPCKTEGSSVCYENTVMTCTRAANGCLVPSSGGVTCSPPTRCKEEGTSASCQPG